MNPVPDKLVIPSSMRFHTPLMDNLVRKNPRLAQDVIRALNVVDRSRNVLWRQTLGDVRINHG